MPTRTPADDPSDMVLDKPPLDHARQPAGDVGPWRFTLLVTVVALLFATRLLPAGTPSGEPSGEINYAVHITLPPSWFDPGEAPAASIPYLVLYLIHDALIKPMPGQQMAPSLAERWSESADGLAYDFVLRQGVTFHNGDPFTADDVKFSFERYRGNAAKYLHERVKAVEIVDPHRVRFVLNEPCPDFIAYYGTPASAAGWIVPKGYVERVGDERFKQQPVGLGPYKLVSHKPGVELVAEAHTAYWRKVPPVKRIVLRSVPDETTRLAMLKRGEADVAFALQGPVAEEVRQTPALKLLPVMLGAIASLDFPEQWDAKSPWHDVRVRQAASLAVDRQMLNDTELLSHGRVGGALVPPEYEFSLDLPAASYDPAHAKQLLAEAGYPHGFEAGDLTPIPPYFSLGEAVGNYLRAISIKTRLRTMERATFFSMRREHALKGIILGSPGMSGNAATWLDGYAMSWETREWGGYADLQDLFRRQVGERDRAKREAVLHEIQRRISDRVMLAPLFQFAWLVGVARRVDEPALGLIQMFPYSAPYEDLRLSAQ